MTNKNIFIKMANYLYKDDAQKEAYLRGCANGMCLIKNVLDTKVKLDELISIEDQIHDIKVLQDDGQTHHGLQPLAKSFERTGRNGHKNG